ncbi:uncharacterized protein SOCE836_068250 [Sorangium cellulosum]|uniref:Uncharacterized protein n=1 Tax=Sorangium cellulosum TaxID=56 RepID=A0A4P2QW20_SORCE|nr:uncharacterized protein SOCE836_068250 [Sorangium cellulosum]WCQ93961.1 hypothetical protein NQZ70_06718 [Sorangium sp. Soce836]
MRAAESWSRGLPRRVALETRNAAAVGEEKQGLARVLPELAQEARSSVLLSSPGEARAPERRREGLPSPHALRASSSPGLPMPGPSMTLPAPSVVNDGELPPKPAETASDTPKRSTGIQSGLPAPSALIKVV